VLTESVVVAGIVGLNNIKANDYCNVILQVCCQLQVCRRFLFLL